VEKTRRVYYANADKDKPNQPCLTTVSIEH